MRPIALATFAAGTFSADAGRRNHGLGLGIVGGLVVGAAIANSQRRNYYDDGYYDERPVYRSRYSAHVTGAWTVIAVTSHAATPGYPEAVVCKIAFHLMDVRYNLVKYGRSLPN